MSMEYNVFVKLRLYLFGEYDGPLSSQDTHGQVVRSAEEKSLDKAIALLPTYFSSMYAEDALERENMAFLFTEGYMRPRGYAIFQYVPDIELWELTDDMQKAEYPQKEIEAFATCFVKEMMHYEKVFRSSMTLLLFGKHISGVDIDIPETKKFEKALSLIPDYVDFLTGADAINYFSEGFVDLDATLYSLIQKMRESNYSQEVEVRFASAWFDAIEAQGKLSLMVMRLYLFGRFQYTGKVHKTVEILNPKWKNFEKALAIIPRYIAYMKNYDDPRWDDGVCLSPKRTLENYLVPEMCEFGYSDSEIKEFSAKWLDYLDSLERELTVAADKYIDSLKRNNILA